ncbi:MAG: nucleotidyl transferase AbiEii/AbiGii toxin family protein [bacterium]|nr:MAG: nucleotidyl transferase AbiEii/AbiGii toxin family protein [bacterium]
MKFFTSILNKNQQEVLPKLKFLSNDGFYLAGGTSLALLIGHRTSVDFDFFIQKHFDSAKLVDKISKVFGSDAKVTLIEKDTVFVIIKDVECSFFWYQYPLIDKVKTEIGINLAGLKDIAAMKLLSVSHRPAKRDYIDIFYLLNNFSLEEMMTFAYRKYKNFNEYLILRALTYYDDAEGKETKRSIKLLDPNFSWQEAKTVITNEVKKYQLAMLKT